MRSFRVRAAAEVVRSVAVEAAEGLAVAAAGRTAKKVEAVMEVAVAVIEEEAATVAAAAAAMVAAGPSAALQPAGPQAGGVHHEGE